MAATLSVPPTLKGAVPPPLSVEDPLGLPFRARLMVPEGPVSVMLGDPKTIVKAWLGAPVTENRAGKPEEEA